MSRTRVSFAILALFLALPLIAKSHVPTQNTHAAIKAYAEAGAAFVAKNGPDCAALKSPDWEAGDYYIFVASVETNKLVCHSNPNLIGKDNSTIIVNGFKVGDNIMAAGKKKGGGWVEYMFPRPNTTNPVAKSSFAVNVKAPDGKWYTVGSGGYELK